MSYFAHQLEALKTQRNLTALEISKRTGVAIATLSRVKKGERNITFDDLHLLCRAFPAESPVLLRARLLDECDVPGGEKLEIIFRDPQEKHHLMADAPPPYQIPLPPALDEAMGFIVSELGHDPKLRNTMLWIGERIKISRAARSADKDVAEAVRLDAANLSDTPPPRPKRAKK
ncbi:MAG: XRE family transcriptional regulator [Hyphomicrobiaceae bacterium]|nr:MAG: XRE family transcriptional regulator [Hyphomicrobiaceae bacterium]